MVLPPGVDIENFDRNGFLGASADAGRSHASIQPAMAHVALAHHAALGIVLRHAVRAVPDAVLAADADLRVMIHDPGQRIFGISFHGTADQAGRLEAVIAAHRQVPALGFGINSAFDLADTAPVELRRVAVLLIAGHDAAFAADALGHVEVEAVLLAGFGRAARHERRRCGNRAAHSQREAMARGLVEQGELNRH